MSAPSRGRSSIETSERFSIAKRHGRDTRSEDGKNSVLLSSSGRIHGCGWMVSALATLAYTLILVHFAVPITYYGYVTRFSRKPWGLNVNGAYRPRIAIILPTYNECAVIEQRIENIVQQQYPPSLIELLVIDASADNTADIVEKWHTRDNRVKVIKQQGRRGKTDAIATGLDHVAQDCEIIVLTDADALWEPEALTKAVAYLSDPRVGCVTARINYAQENRESSEDDYRDWYNSLRLAESKIQSTPIHNGPFFAVRSEVFRKVPLQRFEGSDDSMFGSFIAFTGLRAIQANDITVEEPMRGAVLQRKVRRAQTLLFNFALTPRFVRSTGLYRKTSFDKIWYAEWWLHVVNPWLLILGFVMTLVEAVKGSVLAIWLLTAGFVSLLFKTPRMWFLQQLYLAIGAVESLIEKRIVWEESRVPVDLRAKPAR